MKYKLRFIHAVMACLAISLLFAPGCGLISVLGTPTSSEIKVPAEYNLAQQKDKKILVLVDIPSYLNTYPNLRFLLTDTAYKNLVARAKISKEQLISYNALADYRAGVSGFSSLSPQQVGSSLGADFVMYIVVTDYKVTQVGDLGYYNGSLDAQASLFNVATGGKLWPAVEESRSVKVGFESERRGPDVVAVRLAAAAAHCITRYMYNCPKNQFKTSEEPSETGW